MPTPAAKENDKIVASGTHIAGGIAMRLAKSDVWRADHMTFYHSSTGKRKVDDRAGWALFYWRLRYRLVAAGKRSMLGVYSAVELEERFSFIDEHDALDL